jgi:hypothetical protein
VSREDEGSGWDAAGQLPSVFDDPARRGDDGQPIVVVAPPPAPDLIGSVVRLFSSLALVISVFTNGFLIWSNLDAPNARAEVMASRVELDALREELRFERERTEFYERRLRAAQRRPADGQ